MINLLVKKLIMNQKALLYQSTLIVSALFFPNTQPSFTMTANGSPLPEARDLKNNIFFGELYFLFAQLCLQGRKRCLKDLN
jgi:hypothetical protein